MWRQKARASCEANTFEQPLAGAIKEEASAQGQQPATLGDVFKETTRNDREVAGQCGLLRVAVMACIAVYQWE